MAKSRLRIKAREMRKEGLGIKTIAHALDVSSSTVSLWCRDIVLTIEQIKELERRCRDPYYGKRLAYLKKQQKLKQEHITKITLAAKKQTKRISKRELFFFGIALYWAEGFKKDKLVGFSNSDPTMIKFFLLWLKECCNIDESRIRLRLGLNIHYNYKTEIIQQYWSDYLKIPIDQFQKPFFQKVLWKKTYDNPELYRGVLRVRVTRSTDLLRKIKGWIEGASEYK